MDGNDPLAVYDAVSEAVARARAGKGPTLVECKTYRQHGHFEGDPATYKPKEEQAEWMAKDPMPRYAKFLVENNVMTQAEVDAVDAKVAKRSMTQSLSPTHSPLRPRRAPSWTSIPISLRRCARDEQDDLR